MSIQGSDGNLAKKINVLICIEGRCFSRSRQAQRKEGFFKRGQTVHTLRWWAFMPKQRFKKVFFPLSFEFG
ncbi:hypothetical protein EP47_11015 [Legionella norrlandica]|uniref:Uncharacterized protein n=1 Tax=Legionella norrlandica TaxID=1498499 RepID=A0A0A2T507_9GAMM|nr:hypothetical protein EP47_11015 [Legionella norrlandica]